MYQSYPTGGDESVSPQPPPPVITASRLMYAGAAVSAVEFIAGLTTVGTLKTTIRSANPSLSANQVNSDIGVALAIGAFFALVGIGLWLWMAFANRRGRSWARITATVLFGIDTLLLLTAIVQPHLALSLVIDIVIWLIGLGAIVLIWNKESSAYYDANSAMRR
jgi:MFS family permease